MGSLCCTAGRSQRPPQVSLVASDGWPHGNSNSPPPPPPWDRQVPMRTPSQHPRRPGESSSSSSSTAFLPCAGSPSDSFRAPPPNSRDNPESHPSSGLHASPLFRVSSKKEGLDLSSGSCIETSGMNDSMRPCLTKSSRSRSQPSSSDNHARNHSFFARRAGGGGHLIPNRVLLRQISDSRIHATRRERGSPNPLSEGRHSCRWSGSSAESSGAIGRGGNGPSDWWSMQTFSELVASSRTRERLKWTDATSPSDFGWGGSGFFSAERIIAAQPPPFGSPLLSATTIDDHHQPHPHPPACGICSRPLSHKSPWTSQRMMAVAASNDLAVVGVLVCGHVFHADCLERITPESVNSDPPCPQCAPPASSHLSLKGSPKWGEKGPGPRVLSRNKLSRIGAATEDMNGPEFTSQSSSGSFRGGCGNTIAMPHISGSTTNDENMQISVKGCEDSPTSRRKATPGSSPFKYLKKR